MKIKASVPKITEIDVELPLYRKHDVSGDTYNSIIYMRITEQENGKLREVGITINDRWGNKEKSLELSVTDTYRFDSRSEPNYNSGHGEYALTKDEWDQALAEARKMLEVMAKA